MDQFDFLFCIWNIHNFFKDFSFPNFYNENKYEKPAICKTLHTLNDDHTNLKVQFLYRMSVYNLKKNRTLLLFCPEIYCKNNMKSEI